MTKKLQNVQSVMLIYDIATKEEMNFEYTGKKKQNIFHNSDNGKTSR